MDPATAAVMILLSCSPAQGVCKPLDTSPAMFGSLDTCQLALAVRLEGAPNGEIVGRCSSIDPPLQVPFQPGIARLSSRGAQGRVR